MRKFGWGWYGGLAALAAFGAWTGTAASRDLGNGFTDHGTAVPVSVAQGIAAARGDRGQDVLLGQLKDWRGTYGMLVLDLKSGKCSTSILEIPYDSFRGVFSGVYSIRNNRFYCHHSSVLTEFDPEKKVFSFVGKTHEGMGMAATEDDRGVIWTVTYPDCGLISFDPATRTMKDYGGLIKENWPHYARTIAADDAGWIYFGYGMTKGQLVGFHPATGKMVRLPDDAQRPDGVNGNVFRAKNGKVYGALVSISNYSSLAEAWNWALKVSPAPQWYELYQGKMTPVKGVPQMEPAEIAAGSQRFLYDRFPSGARLKRLDTVNRKAVVTAADGREVEYPIQYESGGAHLTGLAAVNGVIAGGASFPMRSFVYDPAADSLVDRDASLQWNSLLPDGKKLIIGAYNGGFLIEWAVDRPYQYVSLTPKYNLNPKVVTNQARPHVIRPHALGLSADGGTVLMGGTPEYGHTGGGMGIWKRSEPTMEVLTNAELLKDQAIYAFATLPDGRIFGGTTIEAGTGGVAKSKEAELFEFDLASRRIVWHAPVLPGVETYDQIVPLKNGKILGVADLNKLFLFDPATRKVTAQASTGSFGDAVWQQGPRMLVRDGDDLYLLTHRHILKVNPETCAVTPVAESPVEITTGGDVLDGRIYFAGHARIYSFDLRRR